MPGETYELRPVGRVESPLKERDDAPKQGFEGAPEAWIVFEERVLDAMADMKPDTDALVLTWLDRGDREVLKVQPRDDPMNPMTGVFCTRSQDRPNPIGIHRVRVIEIDGTRVKVADLEALDGTPVLDVKIPLDRAIER